MFASFGKLSPALAPQTPTPVRNRRRQRKEGSAAPLDLAENPDRARRLTSPKSDYPE